VEKAALQGIELRKPTELAKMYSKTCYWLLENTSWMASTIGSSCVYYDGKLNLFYITTTARKRFRIVIGFILIIWAGLVGKTVQFHLEGDKRNFALSYALTLAATILTVPLLVYCNDINEYRFLIAEGLKFGVNFQSKFSDNCILSNINRL